MICGRLGPGYIGAYDVILHGVQATRWQQGQDGVIFLVFYGGSSASICSKVSSAFSVLSF